MTALELVRELSEDIPLQEDALMNLFADLPLDFPIHFRKRLPLMAHRFRMLGITLLGRVYLLEHMRQLPATDLLPIILHEAVHVRQQRNSPVLFYLRYSLSVVLGFVTIRPDEKLRRRRETSGRFHAAYRSALYEEEAYRAQFAMQNQLKRSV